MKNEKNTV